MCKNESTINIINHYLEYDNNKSDYKVQIIIYIIILPFYYLIYVKYLRKKLKHVQYLIIIIFKHLVKINSIQNIRDY